MTTFKIPGLGNYSDDSEEEDVPKKKAVPNRKYFLAIDPKSLTLKILDAPINTPNDKLTHDDLSALHIYTESEIEEIGMVIPEDDIEADDDNCIYCDICDLFYRGCCREHPLFWVPDRQVANTSIPAGEARRAEKTKPLFVRIKQSKIPNAGFGAFVEVDIPRGFVFGPYEGVLIDDPEKAKIDGYCWEIKTKENHGFIDGSDEKFSNWMRYINHSNDHCQNAVAFQYKGMVFYRCSKPITKGCEILVHYGNNFAEELYKDCQKRAAHSASRPLKMKSEAKNSTMHYFLHRYASSKSTDN